MKPIPLIMQLALWAVCLAGLNVAVQWLARSSVPRELIRSVDQSPPITDLLVGNSLMAAGFEAQVFEQARPGRRALNIGLGFSSPVEHDILLRHALRLGPNRVYYGFFDLQLFEPVRGGWEDLVGNCAMAYYMDLDTAIRFYAPDNPLRAIQMRVVAQMPALVERYTIWARVEKMRRRLGEIGLVSQVTNRFGRAEDFRLLEPSDTTEFRQKCRVIVIDRERFVPPMVDMLSLLRDRGISSIVVEMPMTSKHRHLFYDNPEWTRLRTYVEEEVRREGGAYLVASNWIGDDGFADHLHLNAQGTAEFSRRLATTEVPEP